MKLKMPSREEVSIEMAPMIDMVFLLLIFFMVASAVVDLSKKKVVLPKAESGKVPEDTTGRLMISVGADGTIYDGLRPIDVDELRKRIAAEIERDPGLRVLIRADEKVHYKTIRTIMAACADEGAVDLIFATHQ